MSGLDWLIAAIVLLSVLLAAAQGFFYELFTLAGVVVGYVAAAWGYTRVASWYAPYVKSAWIADIAGFLTIFIAVALLAGIIGRLARWFFKEAGMRWFDRLLGAAFGLVRGLLVVAVLLLALTSFAPDSKLVAQSSIAPYALVVARAAVWVAPGQVRARFYDGLKAAREMRVPGVQAGSGGENAASATRPEGSNAQKSKAAGK
jgi:membrane protein required for colicin V production